MTGQHPGLRKYWLSSHAKKVIFCIHKMEVEKPFLCMGQSTSYEKRDKINDWNYQIDMLLPKMSRHYIGLRHDFLTKEQQKVCWQPKKLRCMILHDHKNHMSEHLLLQFMQQPRPRRA
jgi:hypothetical protein